MSNDNKPIKIVITKGALRQLDRSVMRSQIDRILSRMLGAGREASWSIKARPLDAPNPAPLTGRILYSVQITITRTGRKLPPDKYLSKIALLLHIGQAAANSSGWVFPSTNTEQGPKISEEQKQEAKDEERLAEGEADSKDYSRVMLSTERQGFFDHIYERDAQVEIVHSAVKAFVDSEYANRFHCVLYGEPACGKTEILRSFTKMLGHGFVLELDATSTTKAGAERILLESANLPPVLICEEIEKTDESSLRWLLGILDHRGEVRKVTHGGGLRHRDVKMLCLATVNDMDLFKRAMDGALASRFSHKVWCPRPSKEVLRKILVREVAKVSGDESWIAPAVDWCVDVEKTNDPRRVVTVCLSGKERLLTGEYQGLLRQVADPGLIFPAEMGEAKIVT